MINRLNIFSNNNTKNFLIALLSEYKLVFMTLDNFAHKLQKTQPNIIIINNKMDADLINLNYLNENCLLIYSLKKNKLVLNENVRVLNTPFSINHIKNTIKSFVQNFKIEFHDISIDNEKITNLKHNLFCYLTKIEIEILNCLIREKEVSKIFIKENILNIKSNIETNSLESHLTRIRKKMNHVKTNLKIKTKSEKLSIIV